MNMDFILRSGYFVTMLRILFYFLINMSIAPLRLSNFESREVMDVIYIYISYWIYFIVVYKSNDISRLMFMMIKIIQSIMLELISVITFVVILNVVRTYFMSMIH